MINIKSIIKKYRIEYNRNSGFYLNSIKIEIIKNKNGI